MLVFRKYSKEVRCKSNRVSIYKLTNDLTSKFKIVYESFVKTNPSRVQREAGIKPKRRLISKQVFEFENLDNIDFSSYIFNGLIADYLSEKIK